MNERQWLSSFVTAVEDALRARGEVAILGECTSAMRGLVARDDWLPPSMAIADPSRYQQHLLYADPGDRFSLVSFVWGPGQSTPIHDHTVWGVIGMLRGSEYSQGFTVREGIPLPSGPEIRLEPGDVETVSPTIGDIHKVRNAYADRTSISIHLYGGNIGKISRHVFDATTGAAKPFISGYSSTLQP